MSAKGRHLQTRVLEQHLQTPTARQQMALRLGMGDQVLALRRLYVVDATPTILVSTALPAGEDSGQPSNRVPTRGHPPMASGAKNLGYTMSVSFREAPELPKTRSGCRPPQRSPGRR